MTERRKQFIVIFTIVIIIALVAVILLTMGRLPICECGYIKLWHGDPAGPETSQHLMDPYTFTHVLHGIGFFFILWLVARRSTLGFRAIIAAAMESIWEIAENTSWAIERYRAATISLDYFGDSVINSISDILVAMFGFWLAARLPVWLTIAVVILLELALVFWIRDGLFLNILMLIYPIEAVKTWQMKA